MQIHITLKKYICSITALLLIIFGMCLTYFRTDSLFAYPEFSTANAVITSNDEVSDEQVLCTNELLGLQRMERIICRISTFRGRIHVQAQWLFCHSSLFSTFSTTPMQAVSTDCQCHQIPSRTAIISYIHHQDGSKG